MIERKFSEWHSWSERKVLPRCPGVYAIARSNNDLSAKAFTFSEEIIYFGMTNAASGLQGRLEQFDSTIIGKRPLAHGGADRVRYGYSNYDSLVSQLYVAVASFPCDPKEKGPADLRIMGDVARLEYLCLAEYKERFDRLPAFNDPKAPKHSKRGVI
jgi:hypothetical protein